MRFFFFRRRRGLFGTIRFKAGPYPLTFTGTSYARDVVLPNLHFHATTAYGILRHNGVPVGKLDYLGPIN